MNPKFQAFALFALTVITGAGPKVAEALGAAGLPKWAHAITVIVSIASALGLAYTQSLAVKSAPKDAAAKPKTVPPLPVFLVMLAMALGLSAIGASCSAATKQLITQDVAQAVQCVATQVLGGVTDPTAIGVACAGLAISDVVAIVEALLAGETAPDGGAALSADMTARLHVVANKGHALLAANAKAH
jgi:hypothetical protein